MTNQEQIEEMEKKVNEVTQRFEDLCKDAQADIQIAIDECKKWIKD